MNYILLFLAVAIGFTIAYTLSNKEVKRMSIYLAFSGAFLLSMTILELLPEVFGMPTDRIGICIMGGVLLQICLEFFSKGAEHGHVHIHLEEKTFPWLLFLSLSIHSLLEGFPISDNNNIMVGIIVHKIPVSIILSFFFIKANYSKRITILFMTLFALMTPAGNYISHYEFFQSFHSEITAVVIGIFLHVSTTILYESSKDHKFNLAKLVTIIVGIIAAFLI